jgi:hypothetical protein
MQLAPFGLRTVQLAPEAPRGFDEKPPLGSEQTLRVGGSPRR